MQIMSVEWVEKCWEHRNDSLTSATDENLVMCSCHILIFITYALYVNFNLEVATEKLIAADQMQTIGFHGK